MDNTIYFCSLPFLDSSYQNVIDFSSLSSQYQYFSSQVKKQLKANVVSDSERTTITINAELSSISKYDYLFLIDSTNKRFFYFINNKIYKSSTSCILEVELDVYSTYLFDHSLLDSYVERCHVNRWKTKGSIPNETQVADEGFTDFQSVIRSVSTDKTKTFDSCYIYASTVPLGVGIVSSGGAGGGACQSDGTLSYEGFRFIKGYEAFSDYGLYLNNERFKTVGYGFTETHNKEAYDKHKPFPCSEETAAELFGEYVSENWAKPIWNAIVNCGIDSMISYHMFDAMVSLAWNCGLGGFLSYDTSPWQLIKENPLDPKIREVWEKFAITSNGEVMNGLVARRKAEADIYFLGEYEKRPIEWYTDNGQNLGIMKRNGYIKTNNGDGHIPPKFKKCELTQKDMTDGDGNGWAFPTTGEITASYPDYRDGFFHGGIDFANSLNTTIKAIGNGTIIAKNTSETGYGKHIIIEHKGQNNIVYRVWYAHLNEFGFQSIGSEVKTGDVIGLMGSTGNSTAPHLHLEIRKPFYNSGSYNVLNGAPNYSVGDTIHPAINLKVGDKVG